MTALSAKRTKTQKGGIKVMKITWIGHSCFKIEQDGYSIITDPYEDGYVPGLKRLREKANMVLCSHEHGDHNARSLIKTIPAEQCPFRITKLETWHDDVKGAKRGPNTIHIIEAGKIRIAHLGDLGCMPEKEQIEALKGLEVCLIPVGGHYTIDGRQAAELIRQIDPQKVIPMHYRDDEKGFGFDVIGTVGTFTEQMDSVCVLNEDTIDTEDLPDAQVIVLTPRDVR